MDDGLGPARGCIYGGIISAGIWAAIIAVAVLVYRIARGG